MKFTNRKDIHPLGALWLAYSDYDGKNNANHMSVTSLLNPIKASLLLLNNEPTIEISNLVYSTVGTAIHDSLERAWSSEKVAGILNSIGISTNIEVNPDVINPKVPQLFLEKRVSKVIDGITINGKYDAVLNGMVHDYKVTSVPLFKSGENTARYVMQMSIYKYLNPELITKDYGSLVYIFRDTGVAEKSKLKPIEVKQYKLHSSEVVEKYLLNKVRQFKKYFIDGKIHNCSDEDLGIRTKYKLYANANSVRAKKTSFNRGDLVKLSGGGSVIKEVKTDPTQCTYCLAKQFCNQYRGLVAIGYFKYK